MGAPNPLATDSPRRWRHWAFNGEATEPVATLQVRAARTEGHQAVSTGANSRGQKCHSGWRRRGCGGAGGGGETCRGRRTLQGSRASAAVACGGRVGHQSRGPVCTCWVPVLPAMPEALGFSTPALPGLHHCPQRLPHSLHSGVQGPSKPLSEAPCGAPCSLATTSRAATSPAGCSHPCCP